MFFTLMSNLLSEALFLSNSDSPKSEDFMVLVFINLIFPGLYAFQSVALGGLANLFSFYFEFYYVGRNKKGFSYFIRYHFVFAMLMTQAFNFLCLMFRIFKGYNQDNFPGLVQIFGSTLFIVFLILIFFSVFKTLQGEQPILPFFDLSVQYHIGIREREDESVIDLENDENEDKEE
jgi:hypothetical protein